MNELLAQCLIALVFGGLGGFLMLTYLNRQ